MKIDLWDVIFVIIVAGSIIELVFIVAGSIAWRKK